MCPDEYKRLRNYRRKRESDELYNLRTKAEEKAKEEAAEAAATTAAEKSLSTNTNYSVSNNTHDQNVSTSFTVSTLTTVYQTIHTTKM